MPSSIVTDSSPLATQSRSPENKISSDDSQHPAPDLAVVEFLDYLEVIVKYRNLVLLTTGVALIVSLGIASVMTRMYSSTALILPPQQESGMMSMMGGGAMASLAGDLLGKGTPADLYAKILDSEVVKDAIIDRFHFIAEENTGYRIFAYGKLSKKVLIEVGAKDGIISITVEDKNPKRAADMANAYVEELGNLVARLNITGASNNRVYLEERLAKVKVDFDKSSDALKGFQSEHKTVDISEQSKGTIREVAELEGRLAAEEVKLAAMRRVLTDSSQDIKNQQAVIGNISVQIAKFEGSKRGGSLPGIGSVPAMGQEYLRLTREFKVQETLLELLTKQLEFAKLSEAKNIATLQVIQKARESDKSIKPSRRKFVMMVTAAAFVLSILLAFALESIHMMAAVRKKRIHGLFRRFAGLKRAA